MRKGYTLAEMLIVTTIVLILALISMASLVNRRNQGSLTATTATMAGLLREAQSRSVSQASFTTWGVHFENATSPFFALFDNVYATSTHSGYYALPAWVDYATSSIAQGSWAEVSFAQISGIARGYSSIKIYLLRSNPVISSTISVASSGAVSY